jgi:hypothetical protein
VELLGETPNGLDAGAIVRPADRQCQYYFLGNRKYVNGAESRLAVSVVFFVFECASRLQIAASSSRNAVSFSAAPFSAWPLQNQIHREFVNGPFQFSKRSQQFIRTHNEPLSVAAMRIRNPDRSPVGIHRETQPQLNPILGIVDHLRSRFGQFNPCADVPNPRCLFFRVWDERSHSML